MHLKNFRLSERRFSSLTEPRLDFLASILKRTFRYCSLTAHHHVVWVKQGEWNKVYLMKRNHRDNSARAGKNGRISLKPGVRSVWHHAQEEGRRTCQRCFKWILSKGSKILLSMQYLHKKNPKFSFFFHSGVLRED